MFIKRDGQIEEVLDPGEMDELLVAADDDPDSGIELLTAKEERELAAEIRAEEEMD